MPSVFPQRSNSTSHLSCQYCSFDVRAGLWRQIWIDESRPFKTNGTEECLTCHTDIIKRTNMCGNRSISSPDVRSFCCQPSSFTSYHSSAMSVVMIHYRRSYYKEQWMVVVAEEDLVNHGRTTSRNGQANRCRNCCASRMTKSMSSHRSRTDASVGVPQRRLGVTGIN